MGVGLQGALDMNSRFNHFFMIGNGTGYKGPETDKFKLFMYSFWVVPVKGLTLQAYADYQKTPAKVNDFVYKGFVAYEHRQFTVGVEGFQQLFQGDNGDKKGLGISFFGSAIPVPGKTFKVFGRFDYWDPDTDIDNNEVNLIIGGLDFIPAGNVHIMPNVAIQTYAQENKDSDITARVTFYYKWASGMF
jgi:hypothetical protein